MRSKSRVFLWGLVVLFLVIATIGIVVRGARDPELRCVDVQVGPDGIELAGTPLVTVEPTDLVGPDGEVIARLAVGSRLVLQESNGAMEVACTTIEDRTARIINGQVDPGAVAVDASR